MWKEFLKRLQVHLKRVQIQKEKIHYGHSYLAVLQKQKVPKESQDNYILHVVEIEGSGGGEALARSRV